MLIVFLFNSGLTAQTNFQRAYGTGLNENAYTVAQTQDGGYLLCGMQVIDSLNTDIYLIKTDAYGDTSWVRRYGGAAGEQGEHAEQTSDGGYIIAGNTSSYGAGQLDVYLVRTDSKGDTIWTRTYGGTGDELGQDVRQTQDGGFLVTGHTDTFGPRGDFYVLKVKPSGDTSWTRSYGGIRHDHGFCGTETSDSGYIVIGHSLSFGPHGGFYAIKINAQGDTLWSKGYGGNNGDSYCVTGLQTSDGGYVFAGETEAFGAGQSDFWLIKTNALGDVMWTKTYGGKGAESCLCVKQTPDGGFILAGSTTSFGFGGTDAYLIKTDTYGTVVWANAYGGMGEDEASYVSLTSDGGYVVSGSTQSYGHGNNDFYLIKTDANGNSSCHQMSVSTPGVPAYPDLAGFNSNPAATPSLVKFAPFINGPVTTEYVDACLFTGLTNGNLAAPRLTIYPNPFTDRITIANNTEADTAFLYNAQGRLVKTFRQCKQLSSFDLSGLDPGIYLFRIGSETARLLKSAD
jgi:hypothetical protein